MDERKGIASDHNLALYTIFQGEVATVQQYGVFIRIPSTKKQGLVHKTQMSNTKVDKPEDVCEVGDKVWCKVISIDADGGKIGLSMKVVSQTTGKDLDPNHVQTSLDEQRRKTGHKKDINRIELGAVLDTDCKKCGGKGHLAQDCFYTPGGQSYDLLPEVDFVFPKQKPQDEELPSHSKAHKHKKKEKKHKKKKKHKHQSSDDSESEQESLSKEKHKRKKKHKHESSSESESEEEHKKKHKKHKRRSSHHSVTDSDAPKHKKKKQEKLKKRKHSHDNS